MLTYHVFPFRHHASRRWGFCDFPRMLTGMWTEKYSLKAFFNLSLPGQNGRHFADDIFKCISLTEKAWISITISLKIVFKDPRNNIPSLVQILGGYQATSHYLTQCWSLGGDLSDNMENVNLKHSDYDMDPLQV